MVTPKNFVKKATNRRRKNHITQLVRHDGTICNDENELGEMTTKFYEDSGHVGSVLS